MHTRTYKEALEVIEAIWHSNGFRTKSQFYRVIEQIKFPFLQKSIYAAKYPNRPVYAQKQYDPIADLLSRLGVVTMHRHHHNNRWVVNVHTDKMRSAKQEINYIIHAREEAYAQRLKDRAEYLANKSSNINQYPVY